MNKVYVISKNWNRHGNFSGYEKILSTININYSLIKSFSISFKLAKILKNKTYLKNYSTISLTKELRVLFKFPKRNYIHILYGDMDYFFSHLLKSFPYIGRKNILGATFHHPPNELEKRINYNRHKVLGALDKIIVMGPNQIPFFKKYTNAEIKFIPHGIDVDFFIPKRPSLSRLNQILIIGISHRDHIRNIEIINKLNKCNLDVNYKVVMTGDSAKIYPISSNIELITHKISDKDLLKYYHESKGLLLSLTDCTASNTILESLATGCPLFINNVGAVLDYIPESSGVKVFDNKEIDKEVDYIKRVLEDDEFANCISIKQRALALKYDWRIVSKLTEEFILN